MGNPGLKCDNLGLSEQLQQTEENRAVEKLEYRKPVKQWGKKVNCNHCERFKVLSKVTISVSQESLQFSCPPLRKEAKRTNKQKNLSAFSAGNVLGTNGRTQIQIE